MEPSGKEEISWISDIPVITIQRKWMIEGINDKAEFVEPDIFQKILNSKNNFDKLDPREMRKARTRSNPFETIRSGIFLNRAAMKMANIDATFEFMFTEPQRTNGESLIRRNELLYFADVCAGPGGFSEYVLWRKTWESKGFGFTLKGPNDFKLEEFRAGSPETFEPYYGEKENGNIYDSANLKSFSKFVYENTDKKGVHFMMADGGFSVEGRENEQEVLSKRLYLCQFLCALMVVRPEGHFVCKLFDIFTPFSVGLIYLICMAFNQVCIFKPNTSRPANSERYIICKCKKQVTKDVADYLYEINEQFDRNICEVVPLEVLRSSKKFYDYIYESNNKIGKRQINYLNKIRVFAQNVSLRDQPNLRKRYLEMWGVPDRLVTKKQIPLEVFEEPTPENLTVDSLKKLERVFEFHCIVCGDQPPSFFLGLGRGNIRRFENSKWIQIEEKLELPRNTLFYGEFIQEFKRDGGKAQKCLHIHDAVFLGDKDVGQQHFLTRLELAEKLAKAVSKTSSSIKLRVKEAWQLPDIERIFTRLMKNECFNLGDAYHIIPTSLMIFKTTANKKMSNFRFCFSNRMQWKLAQNNIVLLNFLREQRMKC